MDKDIDELLKSVKQVQQEMAEIQARRRTEGKEFNVYELCGVAHYELAHSKILAEILSPTGMHGQGARFLNLFADEFGLKEFSGQARVSLEVPGYVNGASIGRFDVFIEDTDSVCVIENKIFAGEQEEQLARYRKFLDDQKQFGQLKKEHRRLVFLTLDGRSSSTLEEGYDRVAYFRKEGASICHWLERCAEGVSEMVSVPLRLYRNHIEHIVTGEQQMQENVTKCLLGNMVTASLVVEHYNAAVTHVKKRLMDEVMDALPNVLPENVRSSWKKNDDDWEWEFNETRYNRYGESGWKYCIDRNYAQTRNAQAWLRVFVKDGEDGYCQVGVFANDFGVKKVQNSFVKWCKDRKDALKRDGWIVEDAYPLYRDVKNERGEVYKFNPVSLDRIMNDADYRKGMVDAIVDALSKLYDKLQAYADEV